MTKEQFERAKEIEKEYNETKQKLDRIYKKTAVITKFYDPKEGEQYGEWVKPFPEFEQTIRRCIIADLEGKLSSLKKEMEAL